MTVLLMGGGQQADAEAPPIDSPGPPVEAGPSNEPLVAVAPGASRFVPVGPVRLVDTRRAEIGPLGIIAANQELIVDVTRLASLPAGRIVAVAVNITATDAAGPGFVTAWPADRQRPDASNLNLEQAGATVPNFAIVPLDSAGRLLVSPTIASHLIVDVAGVFVAADAPASDGRMTSVTPVRLLDTRSGGTPVGAGDIVNVAIGGREEVPANAAAAVVTLTATQATDAGFVTAWPAGQPLPDVSNLNVPAPGATVANLAIVPLGMNGEVSLFSERGTHLLLDVVGWVSGAGSTTSPDGLFVPAGPDRQLDTRQRGGRGALLGGYRADLTLRLPNGLAAAQIGAVAANLTVTETSGALFLTAYPARTIRPETSNLNADRPAQTVATFGVVPVGVGGAISLRPFAKTQAIVDVAGFFTGTPRPADPLAAPSEPTAQGSTPRPQFDAVITDFLAVKGYAGASVAVARDNRIVYVQSYGSANIATGEKLRAEHHFRIASQSKMLTGITMARLIEQGLVTPGTRVWPLLRSRVPLPAGADPRLGAITVEQLLAHESGFPASPDPFFDDSGAAVDAFGPAGPLSCASAAAWMVTQPMESTPGTRYRYANVNFCLLGLVIEAVTGRPWSDVERDEVLYPSGVVDMYLGSTYSRRPLDVAHVTPGVVESGGGYFMESIGAAGAWMGTPVDIVRVVSTMDTLLEPGSLAEMRAQRPSDRDGATGWYGRGLVNYRSGQAYGHTGALQGSRTMVVHEANGLTWSIMVNARFPNHAEVLLALMDQALATTPIDAWPLYDLNRDYA
jgi:CubicO group peptidase (beta-lactamase class C family)